MRSPEEWLDLAAGLVEGDVPRTEGWWPRASALLIRQALEASLDRVVTGKGASEHATWAAKLLVLSATLPDERTRDVAVVWSQLSAATHVNGYGLPPTEGELRTWIATVRWLVERV